MAEGRIGMTAGVFAVVLFAALLHAVWNAAVKASADKTAAMAGVVIGHAPFGALAIAVSPLPAPGSWPYIVAGAALHCLYQLFLAASYARGDLTHVYPIARGSAPLLVAAGSVLLLGEQLGWAAWLGIGAISAGLMSLMFVRRADGMWDWGAATLALLTGCFIAAYSLTDGVGARIAGTALGFYGALSLLNALMFAGVMAWARPGLVSRAVRASPAQALAGGGASFGAFAMVVWAFTQAPIAQVSALRETSVAFALLIGVFALGERLNLVKLTATALTLLGIGVLRQAR
jgi:drug/metabolite transporter (DMT)-like permease